MTDELERVARIVCASEYPGEDQAWYDAHWREYEPTACQIVAALQPQWADIASAPRDGSIVLLHTVRLEPPVGLGWFEDEFTSSGRSGWLQFEADGMGSYAEPTHWMPLPTPPKEAGV